MATTSFDKKFVVKSKKEAKKLLDALDNPDTIKVNRKNIAEENKKALDLIEKAFPSSK